ncbi:MAG: LysM peptidoglycan-binding domain-containing protein [Gemmatimonadaceae bacterium]
MPKRLAITLRAAIVAASFAAVAAPAPVLLAQVTQPSTAAAQTTPAVVKHTVKRGDTLWDIAKFYLKDPFRWPEVFHANTDIVKNPHWIYPGQVLAIDGSAVKPEVVATVDSSGFVVAQIQTRAQSPTVFASADEAAHEKMVAASTLPPVLTVRPGEYEAAPYMVAGDKPIVAGLVIGPVDVPALGLASDAGYRSFDRIYISAPAGTSYRQGDRVIVAKTTAMVTDVGRVVEPTGVMRIDSIGAGGRAIGVIIKQFGAISAGQSLVPLGQSFESTTVRPVAGSYPVTAKLIWIEGSPKLPSVQSYVILGAGASQGLRLGDQFTLFDDGRLSDGTAAPLVSTAKITIVRVTPFGATGIVVHQTQPEIRVGMPSRLTAKMP